MSRLIFIIVLSINFLNSYSQELVVNDGVISLSIEYFLVNDSTLNVSVKLKNIGNKSIYISPVDHLKESLTKNYLGVGYYSSTFPYKPLHSELDINLAAVLPGDSMEISKNITIIKDKSIIIYLDYYKTDKKSLLQNSIIIKRSKYDKNIKLLEIKFDT